MLRTIALALVFSMGTYAFAADDESAKELKALEGEWTIVKFTDSGAVVPLDANFKDAVYIFKGDQLLLRFDPKEAGKDLGKVKLDPSTKPKSLDSIDDKKRDQAIYELDGDMLKICSTQGGARPTEFRSTKENKAILMELKRVKK